MGLIGCRICGSVRRRAFLDISGHCQFSHKMKIERYVELFGAAAVRPTEQERSISK